MRNGRAELPVVCLESVHQHVHMFTAVELAKRVTRVLRGRRSIFSKLLLSTRSTRVDYSVLRGRLVVWLS
jgi:hypothetical protein